MNWDPTVRELSESIAAMERDLIVLQQTHTADHPAVVQKKDLLKAFQNRLQEQRTELEQKFDKGFILRLRESNEAGVSSTQPIAAELVDAPAEEAIRQVLTGTPLHIPTRKSHHLSQYKHFPY